MCDPAESSDPTGIVGIQGDCRTGKIQVRFARQITDKDKRTRLDKTASCLKLIRQKINPDFMGAETNNDGAKIIRRIKQRWGLLSLHGIHTSSNLTEKTRQKGNAMDKPFMVRWLKEQLKFHNILFPEEITGDMKELVNQIHEITGYRTPGGNMGYRRQRGRADDLFMAFLLCCHVFLIYQARWRSRQ